MFEDSLDVKIGQVLFECKNGKELFDAAMDFQQQYINDKLQNGALGKLAAELGAAAYFEGEEAGAFCAMFAIQAGAPYHNLKPENQSYRTMLWLAYAEAGANANHNCAAFLAEAYDQGYPPYLVQNDYMATIWYEVAADMGNLCGQTQAAIRYWDATGVRFNSQKAEKYWLMAAKNGDVTSQYNLGILYSGDASTGFRLCATAADTEKAAYWLSVAANNGNQDAAEMLNSEFRYNRFTQKWSRVVK